MPNTFPKWLHHFTLPPANYRNCSCVVFLPTLMLSVFNFSHSSGFEMLPLYGDKFFWWGISVLVCSMRSPAPKSQFPLFLFRSFMALAYVDGPSQISFFFFGIVSSWGWGHIYSFVNFDFWRICLNLNFQLELHMDSQLSLLKDSFHMLWVFNFVKDFKIVLAVNRSFAFAYKF